MALACGWLSFGIVGPLVTALLGEHPGSPWNSVEFLLIGSPFLLWFVTLFWGWPLLLIPPGARTPSALAELRWFERHPITGIGLVMLVILVAIGFSRLFHR
jgi:hypothetical protein